MRSYWGYSLKTREIAYHVSSEVHKNTDFKLFFDIHKNRRYNVI